MKELEDCLREALEESPYGIGTNDTALETARKYASELLRQRDELREALEKIINVPKTIERPYAVSGIYSQIKLIAEAAIKSTER